MCDGFPLSLDQLAAVAKAPDLDAFPADRIRAAALLLRHLHDVSDLLHHASGRDLDLLVDPAANLTRSDRTERGDAARCDDSLLSRVTLLALHHGWLLRPQAGVAGP